MTTFIVCRCGNKMTSTTATRDGRCFDCWERDNPGMYVSREAREEWARVIGLR